MYQSLISSKELTNLDPAQTVIVDCRFSLADTEGGRKEYKTAHIPGAVYAHLDEDLSSPVIPGETGRHPFPDFEEFKNKLSDWGIDKDTQVVAYDHGHGGIAARLWFLLKLLGHQSVAVLNGGWNAWITGEYPTSDELPSPERKEFTGTINPDMTVEVSVLEINLQSAEYKVVDSRAAERYRGEKEPIDPIAGHIPGAVSAQFADNLGADGLFKNKEELLKRFQEIIGDQPLEKTIFYCGSGVTACHNLLALHHIGWNGAKLFPGSWSKWITDKNRPVAKV
jgi:thiosulfate/3-mercaptopyruvate sulfurtransferase